ncbi:MAG: IS4 family transposase [Sphaerochaetaceae bacterium]|nr:IS4 family transposase [Sphaerochaetaceae bacterium]
MNQGQIVFSQIMDFLPIYEFRKCVRRYNGDYRVKNFTCWNQFLCLAFAQLTYRESLRDIESCLNSMSNRLYHMGFKGKITRTTLADANENRPWHIYADFAQILINRARKLYQDDELSMDLEQTVYALDSTVIDLCLSMFPWAHYRKAKGAVKMHTLLDLRGNIPTFIAITEGKVHDVNILDVLEPEQGAFYLMDRGYIDYTRLHRFSAEGASFVIRAKENLRFRRLYSRKVNKTCGLRCDQTIVLTGILSKDDYPEHLRRIRYYDDVNERYLTFLTNNFNVDALTVAELYRSRWQIELFFKWIKQHLRIKAFYGTSMNSVKTQIWIAITVYVLVAIIKKELEIDASLYTILQIFSVTAFEQISIEQILKNYDHRDFDYSESKQLLFKEL